MLLGALLLACAGATEEPTSVDGAAAQLSTSGVNATMDLNAWGTGYCANITLANTSTSPVTGWTLVVALNQSTFGNVWGATATVSGSQLTLKPMDYTTNIAPAAAVTLGFCGNATGTSYTPTLSTLTVTGGGTSTGTTYALTVTKAGTGSGTVTSSTGGINCGATCSASYASGTTVTLTAAAASGSTFTGWSGACTGTSPTCSASMTAARTVTATFDTSGGGTTYALTVTKAGTGSGTVTSSTGGINCGSTCSASYASGTTVTLTAAAASGSTFAGWSGACTGTGTCIASMSAARAVTATFTAAASTCTATPSGPLLAFPGAQGFGKNVTGGRNGTVVHVTNLNDSGAGSFRDAVSQANRFVVFDVGGYIQLQTAVVVHSNTTIAGQTAPGGGIGFRGGELAFSSNSNIICRYVRVRPGSETASTDDDALSLYRAHDVIVDHSSFEFAPWNNIDAVSDDWQNYPVTNVTFQDSLIADPTGQQFGAHTESVGSNWSWYRNIFANSHNRNPLAKVNTVFVNNVLYNYAAGYTTHTSTTFSHDLVNNYFIFGPASTGTDNTWYQIDKNQSIYTAGNYKDTNLDGAINGSVTTPYWYQGTGTVLSSPWSAETTATPPLTAASAVRVAASMAGPLPRDPIDALVISQVLTLGKGTTGSGAGTVGPSGSLYTSQAETGLANNGYGAIAGGTKPTDTDSDGMPDFWENATGSNPSSNDAMTKGSDGYALIERYVNWLAVPHAVVAAGAAVDVDLSAYTTGFSTVSPTYTVSASGCGAVTVSGKTARYTAPTGFKGLTGFSFTVKGSDGTSYTTQVSVLVTP
jgi:uncharacterized repeat protein (TIGR02543 family)